MRRWLAPALVVAAVPLASCRSPEDTFRGLDPDFNRMLDQPRYDSYQASPAFGDGLAMRPPPEGTVPFGSSARRDRKPPPRSRELAERGRDRYDVFCAACHGVDGSGTSVVATKMRLVAAPPLHGERALRHSDERLFEIVTEGYGLMPGYEAELVARDRWAVVQYVRALQLSRRALVSELPDDVRVELERGAP
jgi:mono/diheme cytochrome c family protein